MTDLSVSIVYHNADYDGQLSGAERAERCARLREMTNMQLKEREQDPLEKMGYRKK